MQHALSENFYELLFSFNFSFTIQYKSTHYMRKEMLHLTKGYKQTKSVHANQLQKPWKIH